MKTMLRLMPALLLCACAGTILNDDETPYRGSVLEESERAEAPAAAAATHEEPQAREPEVREIREVQEIRERETKTEALVVVEEERGAYAPAYVPAEPGRAAPAADASWKNSLTPEVYTILATRAVNKMLDQTAGIYDQRPTPKLYVADIKVADGLPGGVFAAQKQTRDIIEGSRTFTPVSNAKDADYIWKPEVNALGLGGGESPAIQYKAELLKAGKPGGEASAGEWTETLRRLGNDDRSWQ